MTDVDMYDVCRSGLPAETKGTALTATKPPFPPDFENFWTAFPRRVGKLAALRAYRKARTIADAQVILDGVDRYKQNKPEYADWCHPSTWLNQGRWMDEVPQVHRDEWVCQHAPACNSPWRCSQLTRIAAEKAK